MVNRGVGNTHYFTLWYSARDWRFYKDLLAELILKSDPGPILDVGAGTGLLVEGATRWGLDCCGLEGSLEALALAQARFPSIRLTHHLLSEPLPFDDNSFQTAI